MCNSVECFKIKINNDIEKVEYDKNQVRNQQREYYIQLAKQLRDNSNKRKFEDVMSDQERLMNIKDIEAYQSIEPAMYTNKASHEIIFLVLFNLLIFRSGKILTIKSTYK